MSSVLLDDPDRSRFPPLTKNHLAFLDTGARLGRIYQRDPAYETQRQPEWNNFRYYGPVAHGGRFDHHPPPEHLDGWRGISYCAHQGKDLFGVMLTCLIECFRYPDNHVDLYKHDPYFVIFPISRRLTLLDVESDWIARTAVGNANVSTGDQDVAQKWSLAIYEHYNEDRNSFYKDEYARSQPVSLDGIMYRCKGRPSFQSVALYERSQDALTSPPLVDDPLSAEWFRDHIEQQCADVGLGILPRPLSAGGTITAISA